jgi:diguanylate cyclase (GGDEF)-like protein
LVQKSTKTLTHSILLLGSAIIVLLIAYLDYLTEDEISFYVCYAIPISLSSWFISQRAGIIMAIGSTLAWYIVDFQQQPAHLMIHFWNVAVRLSFFVAMAVILSKLKSTLDREKELAYKDPLTGLSNRRAFFERADLEIKRSRRYRHPLTIAYMDLDGFKVVNDQKGHEEGDRLLQSMANCLLNSSRATDAVARLGGDEFVILLPETGEEAAFAAAQKFHQEVLQIMRENNWPVTLSVGVLTFLQPPESVDEIIHDADQLMYASKKTGKNAIKFKLVESKTSSDILPSSPADPLTSTRSNIP